MRCARTDPDQKHGSKTRIKNTDQKHGSKTRTASIARDDATTRRRDDATTRRANARTRERATMSRRDDDDRDRRDARERATSRDRDRDDGRRRDGGDGARFGSNGGDGERRDERRRAMRTNEDEANDGMAIGSGDGTSASAIEAGEADGGEGNASTRTRIGECAECNNSNFSWRKSCKRCGAGKSKELKERERAAQAGWLLDGLEDTTNRIFIKGFDAASTSEDDLREVFSGIGIISRVRQRTGFPDQWPYAVRIYLDERGQKKDEAVITYDDPHAAQSAPSFYDGYELNGKKLHVSIAQSKPKSAPPPSSGGGGGGGGGGYGGGGYGGGGGRGYGGGGRSYGGDRRDDRGGYRDDRGGYRSRPY